MAKRINDIFISIQVDLATGTQRLRSVGYGVGDTVDASISYAPQGAIVANRDLTAQELGAGAAADGSVQTLIDELTAEAKAAEGIV